MVELEKKEIRKMGELHYVTIPKALFDTGVLDADKLYNMTIEEAITDGNP